ncbi:hypothetical protein FOCC_FOCC000987 [Frankliniella occidentalis]|nr:hypothetical protein FOCC_FOCC000987 [Frankliniella occidentalis]
MDIAKRREAKHSALQEIIPGDEEEEDITCTDGQEVRLLLRLYYFRPLTERTEMAALLRGDERNRRLRRSRKVDAGDGHHQKKIEACENDIGEHDSPLTAFSLLPTICFATKAAMVVDRCCYYGSGGGRLPQWATLVCRTADTYTKWLMARNRVTLIPIGKKWKMTMQEKSTGKITVLPYLQFSKSGTKLESGATVTAKQLFSGVRRIHLREDNHLIDGPLRKVVVQVEVVEGIPRVEDEEVDAAHAQEVEADQDEDVRHDAPEGRPHGLELLVLQRPVLGPAPQHPLGAKQASPRTTSPHASAKKKVSSCGPAFSSRPSTFQPEASPAAHPPEAFRTDSNLQRVSLQIPACRGCLYRFQLAEAILTDSSLQRLSVQIPGCSGCPYRLHPGEAVCTDSSLQRLPPAKETEMDGEEMVAVAEAVVVCGCATSTSATTTTSAATSATTTASSAISTAATSSLSSSTTTTSTTTNTNTNTTTTTTTSSSSFAATTASAICTWRCCPAGRGGLWRAVLCHPRQLSKHNTGAVWHKLQTNVSRRIKPQAITDITIVAGGGRHRLQQQQHQQRTKRKLCNLHFIQLERFNVFSGGNN